jgi:hypothetical protein
MILGDSLQIMASLARREDLAGKVRMIYVDPPYGIKFASNFQPQLLGESLRGSSLAGLVDTEQPQPVGEVSDLIKHHEHLPVKACFGG